MIRKSQQLEKYLILNRTGVNKIIQENTNKAKAKKRQLLGEKGKQQLRNQLIFNNYE